MKLKSQFISAVLSLTAAISLTLAGPAQAGAKWTLIPDHIDPATGGHAEPFAINDSGWMTGSIFDTSTGNAVGFLRDPSGGYSDFSVGADTEPRGIDNSNRVVGSSFVGPGYDFNEFSRAADGSVTWLINPGTGLRLDGTAQGTNSKGETVGDYLTGPGGAALPIHGFLLNGSTFTDLSYPGSDETKARGVNDSGVVVGYEDTAGSASAFIDNNGVWTTYNHPGADGGTFFEDINDSGLIVGQWLHHSDNGVLGFHSFLYDMNTHAVTELHTPDGGDFAQAFSLNNLDQVVVIGKHVWLYDAAAGPHLLSSVSVPEPETWAMLIIGFSVVGCAARRRRVPAGA